MTSPTPSSAIEDVKPSIENVTFVIVPGLRSKNVSESSSRLIFWESGGALRLRFPELRYIQFNPEFDGEILQNLTPEWFKHNAENLIKHISNERRSESNQLVFVCEDLGGIIVKKALTLEGSHADLIGKTCACIFFGVPHQAPALNSWTEALAGIMSVWGGPNQKQWIPTPQFLAFLGNTSFQFNQVALWLSVITVYQLPENGDAPAPSIKQGCATLDLSHEVRIGREICLENLVRFTGVNDKDVVNIVDALTKAVDVSPECRQYIKNLSRLSPFIRHPQHDGLDWIMDMIPTFDGKSTSATVLHGDRGIGKSVLSYHLYKSLLQSRQSSDIVVYFSFDVLDRRRRSIMSMLSKIIHQILAVDPKSFSSTIQSPQANDSGLEERNMWALLRSIVQKSKSENITLIVDSVQESDASDLEAVWGNLSKLKDARKTGFRLLCTTDIEPSAATQEKIPSVSIKNQRQFESSWKEFVDRRTNEILSKSPINLEDFKGKLSERLLQPYQFLRPTLIAHHMRLTDSPSTPSCIRNDLDNISKSDLEDTISAIVQKCSSWMKPTIRWLLFARRPLRSLELAVAIALEKSCASSQQPIVDEDLIPQDIAGDLKRQLGPLIDVEDGEIRISHPYTRPILEKRVYPEKQGSKSDHIALTGLCLKYLRRCLEYKSKKGTTPVDDINFEFFEYVVENWHVHYRDPVNDGDKELKLLVDSLLNTGAYLSLLCPLDFTVPSSNDGALYLSVRLGLLDIVEEKLTGSDANKSVLFRIACQYHHVEIVKCFIEGMDDNACIKELHQAMNTADSSLCNVLLDKLLKELQPNDDKLEPTFIAACKIGHEAIANRLVKSGIVIKNISTLLLNEVFDRGHVRIVELLLKERVVTDAPDAYIQNLLEQSKQRGYGSIVELLSSIVEDRRRWGRVITHLEETKTLMLNRFEEVQKIAKGELRSVDQDN